jgi:AraC-like DNA-binding protein
VRPSWESASRATVVFETASLRIRAYRCHGDTPPSRLRGAAPWHSVLFVRSGGFEKRIGSRSVIGDPNHALFFNRGEEYEIRPTRPFDDRVTELEIRPDRLAELVLANGGADADPLARPFARTDTLVDPDAGRLHALLARTIRDARHADPLAVEEAAMRLVAAVVARSAPPGRTRRSPAARAVTARAHEALACDTALVLGRRFRQRLTLEDVAAETGVSPFHLCRVFKARTGLTIHRYVDRLRLRQAAHRLLDPRTDLTRLALELGYSSHSHFTTAFRREFGLPPSAARSASLPV